MDHDRNRSPLSGRDSPGPVKHFLAGLAGYDLSLVPEYAAEETEHERKKLVRIGGSVLIPSFFGFFTAYFYFGPYLEELTFRLLVFFAASFLLLAVDCVIVTTLFSGHWGGLFIRIAMSVCLGFVLSEPALLFLYQKTIIARIQQDSIKERDARENALKASLKKGKNDLETANRNLRKLREQLKEYEDKHIFEVRSRENEKRKIFALNRIESDKRRRIDIKKAKLFELENKRAEKGVEIENKILVMEAEREGKRKSGKPGPGPVWRNLANELKYIERERKMLDQQIAATNAEINEIRADETADSKVNEEFKESGAANAVQLTADEIARKEGLEKEFELLTQDQNHYSDLIKTKEAEIAKLPEDFDFSKRNDVLAQTQALFEVAVEKPVMFINIITLFLLIFFIDTAPVLVKLTAKTGYDEYLKFLTHQRILLLTPKLDEAHAASIDSAKKINDKMMDYKNHMSERINRSDGERSELAEEFNRKINEVLLKRTDAIL